MSSTPTPHQKITPSTPPHFPLHHPTPKIHLFLFETNFVATLHYPHQTPNKINILPHVLCQFKNLKNIRTHQIINIKTQKTHSNLTPSTNFPELPFKIRTPTPNIRSLLQHQNYNKYNSFYISNNLFIVNKKISCRIALNSTKFHDMIYLIQFLVLYVHTKMPTF